MLKNMCGIAGTVNLANRDVIERMIAAQSHRGPDDRGFYVDIDKQIALGHCRLSILDLSQAGHQPMSYENERYQIVYNGEVYNFRDVRAMLEKYGYRFHSRTDTEVIVAAFSYWGVQCVDYFRGMFAFAIWDNNTRRLFLTRDRFGIKPLYWAKKDGVFIFASELKGLLASGLIDRKLDYQAIWDYLSLSSIPPPRSILSEVSALKPGHFMIVDDKNLQIKQYWALNQQNTEKLYENPLSFHEARAELRRLLDESTRLHMISDVPVGAFLSGGIDSTAVVGLMSQHIEYPLKTFSIGFSDKYKTYSELPWAKIASDRFGTEHYEIIITENDLIDKFDHIISSIDQPSGDGVNTYFVSMAASNNVKVSLSGLGGDELFAGYPQFYRINRANQTLREGNRFFYNIVKNLEPWLPSRWSVPLSILTASTVQRYSGIRLFCDEKTKSKITSETFMKDKHFRSIEEFYSKLLRPQADSIGLTTYVETKGYMSHTLLRDSDVMGMAYGLEIRVPLLDHVLAEFAFNLPSDYKLKGKEGKYIFFESIRNLLPVPIISRPKMGFTFPITEWLNESLRPVMLDYFSSTEAQEIFARSFLQNICARDKLPRRLRSHLWPLLVLLAWKRHNRCSL